ncbi:CapA family protein [Jeotgalibacillus proteolyticus]|uniref:Capsular biosynthesis protein n=1 Tax=Jeotgalibacillus proteolyticus TaxID=2082395 RepID=A0A2S5GAF1_9BACL|nr:CapA family protein [Jeotgalibacillus proteolyticus]PPA69970.1 capsular biosynthesis protein [Jeotgalibacillus proteolyticus]
MRFNLFIALWLLTLLILTSCSDLEEKPAAVNHETRVLTTSTKDNTASWITQESTISIGAIGDVLLHDRVYELAKTAPGTYDFDIFFEQVKPLLSAPDFLMANQESIPGGIEFGLSSYPAFNSPQEIIHTLKDAGVDMIIAANNHTIDRGIPPLINALDLYDELELPYAGAFKNADDRNDHRIIEIEGIDIGVLSYTFSTNGIPIPFGFEDSVALIEEERVIEEVRTIREMADVVVVHMHWGNEYERLPNDYQTSWAQKLADEQVDIIFGHHPHVLQPIDQLKQPDAEDTIVFYSLGNFYSGQNFNYTDVGGVASVEVTKTLSADKVRISLSNPVIEPTQVIRGSNSEYIVVPMKDAAPPSIAGETYEETVEHVSQWLR